VFTQLTAQGFEIVSMRNKSNRLEELFVAMVNANKDLLAAKQKEVQA
jgi:ABC-2 type transport system ATP-binding protein